MAVERYADKQIRMFEAILADPQVEGQFDILSEDAGVNGEQFRKMLSFLEALKQIELEGIWEIPFENEIGYEITSPDHLLATLKILDQPALEKQLTDLKKNYPKKTKPLLRPQATELIARAIGDVTSGPKLQRLFESFGVEKSLIVYPNTKWRMVQDVLDYLARSDRPEDVSALENIFREFCHPLTYGGDTDRAKNFEKKLNGWVEYEGYRVVRGKLIDLADNKGDESPFSDILDESGYADIIRENSKTKKDIQAIIDEEKRQVADMAVLPELEIVNTAWDSYKKVLDQISFSIPRITDAIPVISTDFTALELPIDRIQEVMKKMLDSGVLSYPMPKNPVVITSEPIRRFLAGHDIVVKNLDRFKEIRRQTDELMELISKRRDEVIEITKAGSEIVQKAQEAVDGLKLPELISEYRPLALPRSPQQIAMDMQANDRMHSEQLARKMERERQKHERILHESTIPLKNHVLQTILQWLEDFGDQKSRAVSIDFHYFNYESTMYGGKRLEKMLNGLIEEGYLDSYDRHNSAVGTRFIFNGVNIELIKNFLGIETTSKNEVASQSVPITKATNAATAANTVVSHEILQKFSSAKGWEMIRFEFIASGDRIEVFIANEGMGEFHFDDLGFSKKSGRQLTKPLRSWKDMQIMATSGYFTNSSSKENKAKNALEARIKALFPHLNGSPIAYDDLSKRYVPVIKLAIKEDLRQSFMDGRINNKQEFLRKV